MTQEHSLTAAGLTLAYGETPIVEDLNLVFPSQGLTMIVGPNGCGKSTLLRGVARLLRPRAGAVMLDGKAVHTQPTRRVAQTMGLLPQAPIAPDGLSVRDLVARGRQPHRSWLAGNTVGDDRAIAQAIERTGLGAMMHRPVDELSGGQRQRAWIAMALAQEPDILLLDEPTTYLDIAHQIDLLDLLVDLTREQGTAVIVVLHELNHAARYADHLIAMRDGRVVADGHPHRIVTPELVRDVFSVDALVLDDPASPGKLIVPVGRHHTPVGSAERAPGASAPGLSPPAPGASAPGLSAPAPGVRPA